MGWARCTVRAMPGWAATLSSPAGAIQELPVPLGLEHCFDETKDSLLVFCYESDGPAALHKLLHLGQG